MRRASMIKMARSINLFAAVVMAAGLAFGGTADGLHVVELKMYSDRFDDVARGVAFEPESVSCLMAVTNSATGGAAYWLTHDGERDVRLFGEAAPEEGLDYWLRVEIDFLAEPTLVRYLVKEKGGEYRPLKDGEGAEWIRSPAPEKKDVREVEIRRGGGYVKELKEVAR